MILKYKDYTGLCIYMQRIGDEGGEYRIILEDCSNIKTYVDITCDIQEIEILDCIANSYLIDKLFARREKKCNERYENNKSRPNEV